MTASELPEVELGQKKVKTRPGARKAGDESF